MHLHPEEWLIPLWPAPPRVRAVCTTRQGGASTGRYASLNLGLHVGDDPASVQRNRSVLQRGLGVRPVYLNQVHGIHMLPVNPLTADSSAADGAFTQHAGIACTAMVADCLPVLLCDLRGKQVAAAHAGWRGLLGVQGRGVLEAAVAVFPAGEPLLAWLGPCIGPHAFEVGDEVRAAFFTESPQTEVCFKAQASGKWLADLPGLARQRLAALGIARTFGNDGSPAWCTVANASRFFSHRRDGVSGRMAACIWLSD
jgi:YfiH family protein